VVYNRESTVRGSIGRTAAIVLSPVSQPRQPSFLRPEKVFQPYREDAGNEIGFIGAWTESTGLSARCKRTWLPWCGPPVPVGGRARYDDPFAALPPTALQHCQPPRGLEGGTQGSHPLRVEILDCHPVQRRHGLLEGPFGVAVGRHMVERSSGRCRG
jgi:hypothetical protein